MRESRFRLSRLGSAGDPANQRTLRFVLLFLVSCTGCDSRAPAIFDSSIDGVRTVQSVTTVVIAQSPGPEDDFMLPLITGRDALASTYVYDVRLNELRRFGTDGRFERIIARRGRGPGELVTASAIVVDSATAHVWDGRQGRYAHLSRDGDLLDEADLGWRAGHRQSNSLMGITSRGEFIVAARAEHPTLVPHARPTVTVSFVRARLRSPRIDTLYTFETPSTSLSLLGGRARFVDPGPETGPIVLYDRSAASFVRIDRPVPNAAGRATFTAQRISTSGAILQRRSYAVRAIPVGRAERDSLEQSFLRTARRAGAGQVGAGDSRAIEQLIAWPDYLPAVEQATVSTDDDGHVWLKLAGATVPGSAAWLVLDQDLTPVVRVDLPHDIRYPMAFRGALWGTHENPDSTLVVMDFTSRKRSCRCVDAPTGVSGVHPVRACTTDGFTLRGAG
jgi:hypothetical protein